MDEKAAKKIVDGVHKQATMSVRRLAKRHLTHLAALRVKLCLAFLLYGISFAVIAVLFSNSEGTRELSRIEIHDVSSTSLLIWLKDCTMDLKVQDGSSISITETTTEFDPNSNQLHVDWNETADVLSITCSGPASEYGDAVTVVVEIGHTIHFQTFEVVFEPGGGRSLFRSNFSGLDNESLGDKVSASGDEGVIQMYYATMGSLSVQLDHGFVFLYEVSFTEASFVLGGQVDIYLWQETYQAGLDINIQTGDGQNTSSGLCISDWSSRPLPQISNLGGYDYVFSVGSGTNRRPMNIIRNSALSRLYLQSGVWRSQRHCNNTFDSVIRIDSQLEDSFKTWAAVAETRSELLNVWLMGPSLGSEIQSMTSDGFWIFSRFGDALMWFPSGLWNIFTLGLFTLRTSRGTFLVKDSLCTTKHDRLTTGTPDCRPKNSTETLWHQQTMERCAKALRHSLPDGLNLTNDRNGKVYYVDRTFADAVNPFPSLADQSVSIMSSSTSAFVKVDHGPDNLRGPWGLLFSIVMVILALAGGTFACAVVVTLYKMQKRRYLKARSVHLGQGNPGLRELLELENQCNLLLTLVRCLILRSPSGKGTITVQKVIEICVGHFVVMQLLVTPMVLVAILNTNNTAELRAGCNFNEWVAGGCLNVRNRGISTTMLTASITMNFIYFLNTILEYTTRYALNKAEETGDSGSRYKFAMKLRASKVYRVFVAVCLMLSLFFFCSYVVLGVIMVLLGTLLQPERLSPVLLAVGGAVIIAQQVTQKFDEFVEQAKVMAAEWLEKHADAAWKSAQEVIGQLEGVADSALNSAPIAKDALDRMGVNPDAFSAELVMGKARQAAEVVVDSAADQVYQISAESDATGSLLHRAKDVQSSSQAMLAQVAESLPGKVVTEAEQFLQPAATALAQTMLEKLEPGSRSLLEQASTKAGVDPSAIIHTLQASSKAGVDPAVIMQALRGSGDGSFASARSLIEEASSQAGVDLSTMMQALQASTDAGVDFSVLMQGCGAADQLKDLASAAQSSIEDVKLRGVNAATLVGSGGPTGVVTDRVVEMNVPLRGIMEEAVGNSAQLLGALDDLEAGEVVESHGQSLDLENFLVMLGLSKGQLLLLNINAVLLFLSCVSFILIGSTLFLGGGIDALIPQLSATAGTLGTTVAAIRSKSKEFKNADLSSMSEAFQDATSQLQNPKQDSEEKKQQ
ncbi:hypothetical protein AK812_SmicGene29464 [Symbiodinium microadriaticum]|uniref:Uncharacterized protein n=1 Tax=Symbiodinium microadriaticum TaxID=2951 RepID=A0A1Q9D1P6_SYMMI|nr:hypothetical protein AK812_SmicGene29464 [Symbiodinium microadriaticum]